MTITIYGALLLPRAWALAGQIAQQPPLLLRDTRVLFTQPLKRQLVDYLGYALRSKA
jgi:hypothetical protein